LVTVIQAPHHIQLTAAIKAEKSTLPQALIPGAKRLTVSAAPGMRANLLQCLMTQHERNQSGQMRKKHQSIIPPRRSEQGSYLVHCKIDENAPINLEAEAKATHLFPV
jgi:hypothetical protein